MHALTGHFIGKMVRFYRLLLFITTTQFTLIVSTRDRYKAAVVEYRLLWNVEKTPKENVVLNAHRYSEIIEIAAKYETDIIVFPALGSIGFSGLEIPDPENKTVPADDATQDEVLQRLSKAARDNSMYVVVNFYESYNKSRYNTNIVFDRNGTLISKYRKFNLYGSFPLETTKEAEIITFDTDFGVRFGTFIDFDILFESPPMDLVRQGIRDFVYPSDWINELPFLSAIQTQWSWSYGNDVNLLAANRNDNKLGRSGSGLHRGKKIKSSAKQSVLSGSFMIIGNIPKFGYPVSANITKDDLFIPLEQVTENPALGYKTDQTTFKTQLLHLPIKLKVPIFENDTAVGFTSLKTYESEICQQDFCCYFQTTYTSTYILKKPTSENYFSDFKKFRYRYLIFDGIREFPERNAGLQICAIGTCINESESGCFKLPPKDKHLSIKFEDEIFFLNSTAFESIKITAKFTNETVILPIIFESSPQPNFGAVPDPNDFIFTLDQTDGIRASIVFKSNSLISVGLWGRIFSRDRATTKIYYFIIGGSFFAFCLLLLLVLVACKRFRDKQNKRVKKPKKFIGFRINVSFQNRNSHDNR